MADEDKLDVDKTNKANDGEFKDVKEPTLDSPAAATGGLPI